MSRVKIGLCAIATLLCPLVAHSDHSPSPSTDECRLYERLDPESPLIPAKCRHGSQMTLHMRYSASRADAKDYPGKFDKHTIASMMSTLDLAQSTIARVCAQTGTLPVYCSPPDDPHRTMKLLELVASGEYPPYVVYHPLTLEDVHVLSVYDTLIHSGTAANAELYLRQVAPSLSTDQKLELAQLIGHRASIDYDFDRAAGKGSTAQGYPSLDTLLSTWASNTDKGYNFEPAAYPDDWATAGICRDAAVAQAKLLRWLGLKAYTVTYDMQGDSHSTVIACLGQTCHKINWNARMDSVNQEGAMALSQDGQETIDYRIGDENGNLIAEVPSEMKKVLEEMAGFDPRSVDPLVTSRARAVSSDVPIGDHATARIFTAQDPTNATYYGVAGDYRYAQGWRIPGQIGAILGSKTEVGTGPDPVTKNPTSCI
jgi:hypothetical protein